MKKRTLAWIGISISIVVALALALGAWSLYGKKEISMTQQKLQEMIDSNSPFTTSNGVTLNSVTLDLSGGEIGVIVDAQAERFGTTINAKGKTRGTLSYNALEGAFYFVPSELEITELKADGETVGNKVTGFIDKWVDSEKIQNNKDELAKLGNKWANGAILKSASFTLKRIPVYKLPDDFKGNAAKMFLSKVEVRGDSVVAHLSFVQFVIGNLVLGFLFVLIFGSGYVLVTSTES